MRLQFAIQSEPDDWLISTRISILAPWVANTIHPYCLRFIALFILSSCRLPTAPEEARPARVGHR